MVLGCLFAIYIDPIFAAVNYVSGGGVWDPSIRGIYALPAKLRAWDVAPAVSLSLRPLLGGHAVPGAPRGADEPGRGAAL